MVLGPKAHFQGHNLINMFMVLPVLVVKLVVLDVMELVLIMFELAILVVVLFIVDIEPDQEA